SSRYSQRCDRTSVQLAAGKQTLQWRPPGNTRGPLRVPPSRRHSMKPAKLLTIAAVALFVGFLLWTTLGAQQVECEVCVEYAGQRNCATASNETEPAALAAAQT